MGRLYLGAGLLAALLALGAWTSGTMTQVHQEMAGQLEQAAQAAQESNWGEAQRRAEAAGSLWAERRHGVASLADHTPMDEIDALFARLTVLAQEKDYGECAPECRELAVRLKAMGEAHTAHWWNLF